MKLKRKHHFVSQFYLKNWYDSNEKIIVWDGDKDRPAKADKVAHQRDLYKIVPLKSEQIELFTKYIESAQLTEVSTYKLAIKEIIRTQKTFQESFAFLEEKNIEIPKEIEVFEKEFSHNIMEEKFSLEEDKFSSVLKKLILGYNSDITLNDYDTLMHFFAFQLARTPKKLNEVMNLNLESDFILDYNFTEEEHKTFNTFLTQCLLEKVYLHWVSQLYEIKIYNNISNINFITSDDPCFNQKYNENGFFIQLPISPRVMIELVSKSHNKEYRKSMLEYYNFHKDNGDYLFLDNSLVTFHEIEKENVINLNKKIFKNKDRFVYAQTINDINCLI